MIRNQLMFIVLETCWGREGAGEGGEGGREQGKGKGEGRGYYATGSVQYPYVLFYVYPIIGS